MPSLPFMKFVSTRDLSWDVTPSLHSCGETVAGSVTEFKGQLPVFWGTKNFTCSAGRVSPSMPSGSPVVFECPMVLKQEIWMVTMLVASAVAASMFEGWPDTVVSRTAPRCFQPLSFCSAALLAAGFLGVVGSLRVDSHLGKTCVRGSKNKICSLSSRFRKFLLPSQVWFSIQVFFGAKVADAAAAWCVVSYIPGQFVCEASAACCTLGALSYFFALVKYGLALTEGFFVTVSGFCGATGCVGSASPSRGLVLGLRMLLDEASRLGADKVLLQMSGYSRRFAAPNVRDLDVIRRLAAVRAGAACDGVSGVAG